MSNSRNLCLSGLRTAAVVAACFLTYSFSLAQPARQILTGLPGMAMHEALDYPDKTSQSVGNSRFVYELFIGGARREQDGGLTRTQRARVTARKVSVRDARGRHGHESLCGTHRSEEINREGKRNSSVTTTFSYYNSDSSQAAGEGQKPIDVSKKLRVTNFAAPTWKIVHMNAKSVFTFRTQTGTTSDSMDMDTSFDIRIPNHGAADTAFAAVVNRIEQSGNDEGMFLPGDNFGSPARIEAPWNGKSSQGSFTANVEAVVGMGMIAVNTVPACEYMSTLSGRPVEGDTLKRFPGTLRVSWFIGTEAPEGRLTLAPTEEQDYALWLPTPNAAQDGVDYSTSGYFCEPLDVTARFEPHKEGGVVPMGRIDFWLTEVSSHRGRCCNHPRSVGNKDDLRFAVEQSDAYVTVDPADPLHAYTTRPVKEASVLVEALDTGAYGRVEARCDELGMAGEVDPTGDPFLVLPRDDDENQVADKWEMAVAGMQSQDPACDDDPQPAGHALDGDSIGLYREYRGFCVLGDDGSLQFRRTDPRAQELFVIDAGGVFDTAAWQKASGIVAYKVDDARTQGGDDRTQSRIVDYTMDEDEDTHVYAVRVECMPGDRDTGGLPGADDPGVLGYAGPWPISQPRDAQFCRVFPARHRSAVDHLTTILGIGTAQPNSKEAQWLKSTGLPPHLWQEALQRLSEPVRAALAEQCIRLTAIHEVGHCCGLPGHVIPEGEEGAGNEGAIGDPACPMRYGDRQSDLQMIVLQSLFKPDAPLPGQYSAFCKEDHNCWSWFQLR